MVNAWDLETFQWDFLLKIGILSAAKCIWKNIPFWEVISCPARLIIMRNRVAYEVNLILYVHKCIFITKTGSAHRQRRDVTINVCMYIKMPSWTNLLYDLFIFYKVEFWLKNTSFSPALIFHLENKCTLLNFHACKIVELYSS